ncbi:MAG: hypothetical protein A2V78_08900 [Betaproteobacteria bacterium RBG_16_64_18]|nr:MAG: hypothetical protein A2V78_08900 [Betaproteobacteria bacterium RBG_16_64_18]OGA11556.1 MAG: hypothetical protein A3H33_00230 [Betaproteobacteria bacterium RIFCSPLOWO2_02_FULL_65_20]OGA39241.1 MAG: hypothetical protein A3G26_02900 [Betaproteobacteria bacterium RIFCSPLOWO2_12_FULL_65_110]
MDEIVLRSMLKWPNVPSVYGWLRLDRRGRWAIRMPPAQGAGDTEPRFDRIVNPAMIEFIGRNYSHDAEGRYFFQNGPQRVYVALEYTPWIYGLDGSGRALVAHTGVSAGSPNAAYFDERGGLVLACEPGVGVVLDRDLAVIAERFADRAGHALAPETLLEQARAGQGVEARLMGADLTVSSIRSGELAARFGFVPRPVPPEGQPDC